MDEYQEQPYLLDPWLEKIIGPPVERFRAYAFAKVSEENPTIIVTPRIKRLSYIIYYITKTRGHKVIGKYNQDPFIFTSKPTSIAIPILTILYFWIYTVPFFPHQVSDLKVAIAFANLVGKDTDNQDWNSRFVTLYVTLLWLSLICRIPFDLSSFDDEGAARGQTAQELEDITRASLDKSGLERDAAALLLAHLYTRYGHLIYFSTEELISL